MEALPTRRRPFRIGFRTSIVTVFIAVVLLIGLTLVYLSFERVSRITRTAAPGVFEKVSLPEATGFATTTTS
jgi:adenylate cyclase